MTESEQPESLVEEVEEGRSERTPWLAQFGVAGIVAVAVAVVLAIVFLVYYLAK